MPTRTRPKPPAKPDTTATRKALLAHHSELQKYHEKLAQWENLLVQKNAELIEMREEFEEMVEAEGYGWDEDEDEECECTPEDAKAGCPCGECDEWRFFNQTGRAKKEEKPVIVGDEVVFLEGLFKLKDKRK